jgi:hypothetical protein
MPYTHVHFFVCVSPVIDVAVFAGCFGVAGGIGGRRRPLRVAVCLGRDRRRRMTRGHCPRGVGVGMGVGGRHAALGG